MEERFIKLLARIFGNGLTAFATVFLASSWITGEGAFDIALATSLLMGLLACAKELLEYGNSGKKLKGALNSSLLF